MNAPVFRSISDERRVWVLVPVKSCSKRLLDGQQDAPHTWAVGETVYYCEGAHERYSKDRAI